MPKNQRCWPRAVGDCERVDVTDASWGAWGCGESATIITRRIFVKQMSPRKYDMSRRASAAEQTRRRIIEAARELHVEQGISATSWDAIAARAGVGVGT